MHKLILSVSLGIFLAVGQTVPAFSAHFPQNTAKKADIHQKIEVLPTAGKRPNSSAKKKPTASKNIRNGPAGPNISADAAVLIDAVTGQILYDKQAHKHRAPASTTKIMTTILALEYGKLDQIVTVSEKAASVGQATIHLEPGEKISLRNLIEGALIKSGNDACVAIAENISGDEASFVRMMNSKAKLLGAYDTNFENTNGLPNSKHFSSAYDLALMARFGMKLPLFSEITRKKETAIESVDSSEKLQKLEIRNTNKLLWMYEFADGVKTGTTNAAGKCLVSSATKNGRQLVAVVLDAPARFQDCIKLLEYGFNNFQAIELAKAGDEAAKFPVYEGDVPEIPAVFGNSIEYLGRPEDKQNIQQRIIWNKRHIPPVKAGEQLGEVQYWLKDQLLGQSPLYAAKAVKNKNFIKRLFSYRI